MTSYRILSHRRIALAFRIGTLLVALACAVSAAAWAAGSGDRKAKKDAATDLYARGVQAVEAGEYERARGFFEKAAAAKRDDPDILNMLAFTQRKTGQLDRAFNNYERALQLRSMFPQAREYLAEAHLQAALLQAKLLHGYGSKGEKELQQLRQAFRDAARELGVELGEPGAHEAAPARKW